MIKTFIFNRCLSSSGGGQRTEWNEHFPDVIIPLIHLPTVSNNVKPTNPVIRADI